MNQSHITIKGTREGLIFYFNTIGIHLEELLQQLRQKLAEGAALIGNSTYAIAEEEKLEPAAKEQILAVFAEFQMKKADIKPVKEMPKSVELPEYVAARGIEPTCYEAKEGDSVLISRSVRSGQCLHIVGNAIIMGDVNAGAQVMATGNIVIMGKLKGLVHAGIYGDREAYIVAWQMDPIQIRIADVLSRSEDNSKLDIQYPEIAKIENGQIIIQPYRFSKSIYQKKVVIA